MNVAQIIINDFIKLNKLDKRVSIPPSFLSVLNYNPQTEIDKIK